jgi:hypothetical protein
MVRVVPGDFLEIDSRTDCHFVLVPEASVNVAMDDGRFARVLVANHQQFVVLSLCQ